MITKEVILVKKLNAILLLTFTTSFTVSAKNYHTSKKSDDGNIGTNKAPSQSIKSAAS